MKKAVLLVTKLTLAMLLLTGCGKSSDPYAPVKKLFKASPDTDVTSSPRYNFSSFSGTVWQTKVKTALADLERYTGAPETNLLAPHRFDPTDPNFRPVEDMKNVTVLPVGTHLRIERLMKDNGASGALQVTVAVADGTNTQKTVFLDNDLLASNQYLAYTLTEPTNWGVNPEMLEPFRDADRPAPSGLEAADTSQSGYEMGFGNGKQRAILAQNVRYGNRLSDPWTGYPERRLLAVKVHGEDYVAAYESGYSKGFHEYSEKRD